MAPYSPVFGYGVSEIGTFKNGVPRSPEFLRRVESSWVPEDPHSLLGRLRRYASGRECFAPVGFLPPSGNGIRQRGYLRPRPYRVISPSTPFRSNYSRIDGVGNRPPLSAITALKEGRLARRRISSIPPVPAGTLGLPAPLSGPSFLTVRAAKDEFIPLLFYAPGTGPAASRKWRKK